MGLNKALITVEEADSILSLESDWLALSTETKEKHIERASYYIQLNWTCSEIDWNESTTITDDVKSACSYYALADYYENLYSSVSVKETGKIIEESDSVGSLKSTIKYDSGLNKDLTDPLQFPNALMGFDCTKKSGSAGSVKAVRV